MQGPELAWTDIPEDPEILDVYHLRRSGGHGVIDWLFGHHQGEKIHYNQALPGKGGGAVIAAQWIRRTRGSPGYPSFSVASFEDIGLRQLAGRAGRLRPAVLILRDPFNTFASRLKMIRNHRDQDDCGHAKACRIDPELWKQYAREFLCPRYLPEAVRVNFNSWYADPDYRRYLSHQFGWAFVDAGFGSRHSWRFSRGSSFREQTGKPLELVNRWKHFQFDTEFRGYLDAEIFDLSEQIFGFAPKIGSATKPLSALCAGPVNPAMAGSDGREITPVDPSRQSALMSPQDLLDQATQDHNAGRFRKAETSYRDLLREGFRSGKICNLLGVLYFQTGRTNEAVRSLDRAIEFDPDDVDAFRNYALVLEKIGRTQAALEVLHVGLKHHPNCLDFHRKLGWLSLVHKEFDCSIEHSRRVVARDPSAYKVLANLATAYFFKGDLETAVKYGAQTLQTKDRLCIHRYRPPADAHARRPVAPLRVLGPRDAQQIISFSLWGDQRTYTEGAIRNTELAHELYPEWVCRFYCAESVPRDVVARLERLDAQVYLMPTSGGAFAGSFWRFFVADDQDVERFLCRDCDSRLNPKERAAVQEWIDSGRPFHIMRDAIVHCDLILAGMWGGVTGRLPHIQTLFRTAGELTMKSADQEFLAEHIWPLIRDEALVHDTFYAYGHAKPFPAAAVLKSPLHVGAGFPIV